MDESALEALWLEAEGAQQDGEFIIRRLQGSDGLGNFIGVEGNRGRRLLVLELGLDEARIRTIASWNVVEISYVQGPEFDNSIQVKLLEGSFKGHFTRLAKDLHERTCQTNSALQKLDAITKTLREWKAFVENKKNRVLTDDEERGLLAELTFLRKHIIPAVGPAAALHTWYGPRGMRHDFQVRQSDSRSCFEVKSNTLEKPSVRISSLYQLDDRGLHALWLYVLTLQYSQSEGETLPEAVAALLAELGEEALREAAVGLLGQAGYDERDAEKYSRRFSAVAEAAYQIQDGFPRVVGTSAGVDDVRYSVNLAHAAGFRCSLEFALEEFTNVG